MAPGDGLGALLRKLLERKQARWFLRPVDPVADGVPTYAEVIRSPMDLGTISRKLQTGAYERTKRSEFAADVRLMVRNATTFNADPMLPVHKDAVELGDFFEARWASLEEKRARQWQEVRVKKGVVVTASGSDAGAGLGCRQGQSQSRKRPGEEGGSSGPKKAHKCGHTCAISREFMPEAAHKLLTYLVAQPEAYHFNEPVDAVALGIPHYHEVIGEPMDLGTIQEKIARDLYDSTAALVRDIRLVIDNATVFNDDPASPVHVAALSLGKLFDAKFQQLHGVAPPPPDASRRSATGHARSSSKNISKLLIGDACDPSEGVSPRTARTLEVLDWRVRCRKMLEELGGLMEAYHFLDAVDPVKFGVPDYFEKVRHPMDLGTVCAKLPSYRNPAAFSADLELIVANALLYNADPRHPVHTAALKFRASCARLSDRHGLNRDFDQDPTEDGLTAGLALLVRNLEAHVDAFFFTHPVDPDAMGCSDYLDKIKHPMDLNTLAAKLPTYLTAHDFYKDASLIFLNAKTYNDDPAHAIYQAADRLEAFFDRRFTELFPDDGPATAAACRDDPDLLLPQPGEKKTPAAAEGFTNAAAPSLGGDACHAATAPPVDRAALAASTTWTRAAETEAVPSDGRDTAALAMEDDGEAEWNPKQSVAPSTTEETMDRLLDLVLSKPNSRELFGAPVDPIKLCIPDYPQVIARPMDLGTIRSNLRALTLEAFVADVRLVFANARKYNKSRQNPVHMVAVECSRAFEKELKALGLTPELCDRDRMKAILDALVAKKDLALFFLEPVDPERHGVPGYFDKIQRPMDLGTIRTKLDAYQTLEGDFAADVRLVFANALAYHGNPKLLVHDAAKKLAQLFEIKLAVALKKRDLPAKKHRQNPARNEKEEEKIARPKPPPLLTQTKTSPAPAPAATKAGHNHKGAEPQPPDDSDDGDEEKDYVLAQSYSQSTMKEGRKVPPRKERAAAAQSPPEDKPPAPRTVAASKLKIKIDRLYRPSSNANAEDVTAGDASQGDEARRKARAAAQPPPPDYFTLIPPAPAALPIERRVALPPAVEDLKRQSNRLNLLHWTLAPLVLEGDVPDIAAACAAANRASLEVWHRGVEYLTRRHRYEELVEERKAERIRDAQRREAERVREELADVERRRVEEEAAEANRLEEERLEVDAAEKRRAVEREQKRRERSRLAQTVDLDKDRLEVNDFLSTYGGGAIVAAEESLD